MHDKTHRKNNIQNYTVVVNKPLNPHRINFPSSKKIHFDNQPCSYIHHLYHTCMETEVRKKWWEKVKL